MTVENLGVLKHDNCSHSNSHAFVNVVAALCFRKRPLAPLFEYCLFAPTTCRQCLQLARCVDLWCTMSTNYTPPDPYAQVNVVAALCFNIHVYTNSLHRQGVSIREYIYTRICAYVACPHMRIHGHPYIFGNWRQFLGTQTLAWPRGQRPGVRGFCHYGMAYPHSRPGTTPPMLPSIAHNNFHCTDHKRCGGVLSTG